jgi:hypothetical protein
VSDTVLAATLVAPFDLRVQRYPYPSRLEPGAVLLRMLASGICGTDKHTYRGETEQYVGTEHASSTPFPIIQGHENVGVVVELGPGGATVRRHTTRRRRPGSCPRPTGLRSLPLAPTTSRTTSAGARELRTRSPRPPLRTSSAVGRAPLPAARDARVQGPRQLPTEVAVLTELFAVTHSLDLVARMPRPGGYRPGDTRRGRRRRPGGRSARGQGRPHRRGSGDRDRPLPRPASPSPPRSARTGVVTATDDTETAARGATSRPSASMSSSTPRATRQLPLALGLLRRRDVGGGRRLRRPRYRPASTRPTSSGAT